MGPGGSGGVSLDTEETRVCDFVLAKVHQVFDSKLTYQAIDKDTVQFDGVLSVKSKSVQMPRSKLRAIDVEDIVLFLAVNVLVGLHT